MKPSPIAIDTAIAPARRTIFTRIRMSVSPGSEARTALGAAVLLILVVSGFVVLKTIRDATFLSKYSARVLPTYMAWNTVVSSIVATLVLRLYKKISLRRLLQAGLLIFAAGTFLVWDHLPGHISIQPTIFYLWVGVYGTLIPVQAWALVSTQLSTRQAKQSLGIIGAGGILGGILGGVLSRAMVNLRGVHALFPCAAGLIFLAAILCPGVSGNITEKTPPPAATPSKQKMHYRYAMLLLAIVIAGNIFSTFLDFQFKTYTQQQILGDKNLARFLGTFYAYLGAASLAFQLFVTPFILRKIGTAAGLSAMPLLLFLGSAVVSVRRSFSSLITLRGSEELLRHSLDRSSLEVIQLAIPAYQKIRMKSWVETIGARAAELVGCLILVAFFSGTTRELPVSVLTTWNMGLLALWFICALVLSMYEYPRLLRDHLRREELDFETVRENLFTNEFYRSLPVILRNSKKESILRILQLLGTSEKRWFGRYLVSIDNRDPEIRLKTLEILFLQKRDMTYKVKRLLSDEDPRVRAEAIHYVSARARAPQQFLPKPTKDEELIFRVARSARDLGGDSPASAENFEQLLNEALEARDDAALQEIAHVLAFIPPKDFSVKVYRRLLSNQSVDVRKAALRSISNTKPQTLIPYLLRLTRIPALRTDVQACLASYGKTLIPYLQQIIMNPGESVPRRKLALKIAEETGGISILESALRLARDPDLSLRFSAIKTLSNLRKKGIVPADHPALRPLLLHEIETMESETVRSAQIDPKPGSLLQTLLNQRLHWAIERVFRLLGLIYSQEDIYDSYVAWSSGDQTKRDAALEVLERILDTEIRSRLVPILEGQALAELPEDPENARREAIESVLNEDDLLISALIDDMSEDELKMWAPNLEKRFELNDHALVFQALQRRLQHMETTENNNEKALTSIDKMETLSKIDIFAQLSPPELLLLSEASEETSFDVDSEIYREGDAPEALYCLIRGKVGFFRSGELLGTMGANRSFGTHGVLANKARISSAVAMEPCVCLLIPGDTFWEILEDYSTVCHGIIEVLAQQIEALTDRLAAAPRETSSV